MGKAMSMIRNRRNDASKKNTSKTIENSGGVPWSDLSHDVLYLVMMKVAGVIDFFSFSGVCKSWRSLAIRNRKIFMASRPPMRMWFDVNEKEWYCYLEDFEGRSLKTLIPHSSFCRKHVGLTCGYLVFYAETYRRLSDFWLVNPITRHQLHFPDFPTSPNVCLTKAILVFSPSLPGWVLVVINRFEHKIWFSIVGKGAWNHVSSTTPVIDVHAFKGKIYTKNCDGHLYELRLNPMLSLSILEFKDSGVRNFFCQALVSVGENIYVINNCKYSHINYEVDFGEMKRVSPEEKTIGEYAFFLSRWKHSVAIKHESLAVDPRSIYKAYDCFHDRDTDETQKGRFFDANSWYFPNLCLDVDILDE